MRTRALHVVLGVLSVATTGIAICTVDAAKVSEGSWMTVARDSSYTVAIDTTRFARKFGRGYVAWYRTDHADTHAVKGVVFNRELVQAIVLCDNPITFKVASVDLSLGDGRPVSKQRTSSGELYRQKWRSVESGTVEEQVAKVTCGIAKWRR